MRALAVVLSLAITGCFAGVAPMYIADGRGSYVAVEARGGHAFVGGAVGVSTDADAPVAVYGRVDAGMLMNGLSDDSPSPIGRVGGGLYVTDKARGMAVFGAGAGSTSKPICSNRASGMSYGGEVQVRYVGRWQVALAPYVHYVDNNVGCL